MAGEEQKGAGLTTVAVAALVGGLAGAALGILLAPKSGKELRQDLGGKAHEIGDKAHRAWRDLEETAGEKVAAVQTTRDEFVHEGKKLVAELQTMIQEFRRSKPVGHMIETGRGESGKMTQETGNDTNSGNGSELPAEI